jgi:hypothetical protein
MGAFVDAYLEYEATQPRYRVMIDPQDGESYEACVTSSTKKGLTLDQVMERLTKCDACRQLNWRLVEVA